MRLELSKGPSSSVNLKVDDKLIGNISYSVEWNGEVLQPQSVLLNDHKIRVQFTEVEIDDYIKFIPNGLSFERRWEFRRIGRFAVYIHFQPSIRDVSDWIVPSVMYQQNKHGNGKYPRGDHRMGWSFREDRSAVPGASILMNSAGEWSSIYVEPASEEKFVSSTKTSEVNQAPAFTIRIPFSEEPTSFIEKGIVFGGQQPAQKKFLLVDKVPYVYKRNFYLLNGVESRKDLIQEAVVESAWDSFSNHKIASGTDWSEFTSLKLNHLLYLIKNKDPQNAFVRAGKGNGIFQPVFHNTSGAFLVRSLDAAWVLTAASKDLNSKKCQELATRIGNFFLGGKVGNGLHQDNYGFYRKKFGGYVVPLTPKKYVTGCNTRCNGEVFWGYLQLYQNLQSAGVERKDFLELIYQGLIFYRDHQLDSGSFGRWWTREGTPLNTEGTNGAHMVIAMADYAVAMKTTEFDECLMKAARFYQDIVDKQDYYADTLDADCIDKEAGVALMRAFLSLYQWRNEDRFLEYAKKAARFVLTWVWTYNVCWPKGSLADDKNVLTKGLTSVSVDHHHLDFYGFLMAYDFLRLARYSHEDKWQKYAKALLDSCGQLMANKDNRYLGRSEKFLGWQPEQINHTSWDYAHHRLRGKGAFHNCIAWPVNLGLHGLMMLRRDFPEFLTFKIDSKFFSPDSFRKIKDE